MANQNPAPPVAAHATRVYGQYFDGFQTEKDIQQAMIDLHGANVIEKSYMSMHLQYLAIVQAGRTEMVLSAVLGELRALRQQVGPLSGRLEELLAIGADAATAAVQLAEMGLGAGEMPEGLGNVSPPLESSSIVPPEDSQPVPALPPGVEPFGGFEPDPVRDSASGLSELPVRSRPMVAPVAEPSV